MAIETAKQWFDRFPDLGNITLFTLRFPISSGGNRVIIAVRAYEGPQDGSHTRLFCELDIISDRKRTGPLFPRDSFHVGIPAHQAIDGNAAKELVLALFAMKPGDTDAEFFRNYTPEQLAFVEKYGEEIGMIREDRYCDENGNVK